MTPRPIQLHRETKDGWDLVRYEGPMNEEAGLHLLGLYETIGPRCVFNFGGLTSVNSKGIASWMNFIRDFREGRQVAMEECPSCFVTQLNMIPSLTLRIDIRSVSPTFVCEACNHMAARIVPIVQRVPQLGPNGKSTCDKCRGSMRLEEAAEDFFFFLETD